MITYKKISKVAGVSESTVSKALSGSGEISLQTVKKIRNIACELGYYSDKRALKRAYSGTFSPHIAIICPEIVSITYSKVAEILIKKITEHGGRATVMISRFGSDEGQRIAESIAHNPDFDGVLSMQRIDNPSSFNIPIVFLSGGTHADADMIYCESGKSIDLLVSYLVDKGHTAIGFIGENYTISKEKYFRESLKKHGLPVFDEYIVCNDKRFYEVGVEGFREYMRRGISLPEAVVCAYDEVAVGFMSEAHKNCIRIPEDISVVGINNTPCAEVCFPPLTSVSNWREEIADKAYELLVSRILGSTEPFSDIMYESYIIERSSVKTRK